MEAGEASSSEEEPPSPEDKENQVPKRAGPHLRFEISSDDGFSVEAESLEGELRAAVGEWGERPYPILTCGSVAEGESIHTPS